MKTGGISDESLTKKKNLDRKRILREPVRCAQVHLYQCITRCRKMIDLSYTQDYERNCSPYKIRYSRRILFRIRDAD